MGGGHNVVIHRGASLQKTMADSEQSLTAVFKTKSQYALPLKKYMIPSNWARYHLSQLINKVLELPTPVPFDFLINGQVLRGTLAQWCNEKGLGTEESLEIEYVESMLPPQYTSSIDQDDWVSAVSCQLPSRLISASYDGSLKVHTYSKTQVQCLPVHTAPITSACIVGTQEYTEAHDSCLIATGSQDMTAVLTRLSLQEEPGTSETLASLHLHTAPVSAVDSDPSGSMLLTASWDNLIGLWDASIPEVDDVVAVDTMVEKRNRKRRKTDSHVRKKAPLEVLRSHTHRVSQIKFTTDKSAISCGWDSTIRTWDLTTAVCDGTLTAVEKPFTALEVLSKERVFVNSTDRTLSLYDLSTRANTTGPQLTFMHPITPSCIAKSPSDPWRVLTGAYDGVVRIWDTRSAKTAVSSFHISQQGKVLSADWGRGTVVLGGEHGLDIWRISDDGSMSPADNINIETETISRQ